MSQPPVSLGIISACAGQALTFGIVFRQTSTTYFPLTGIVLTSQVRKGVPVTAPLAVPSITMPAPGETDPRAEATAYFGLTEAQMAALPSRATTFQSFTSYTLDIEAAYADDPTTEVLRFYASINVYPGGLAPT